MVKRKRLCRALWVLILIYFLLRVAATWVSLSGTGSLWAFCMFSVPFLLGFAYEHALLALGLVMVYCLLFAASFVMLFIKKASFVGLTGLQIVLLLDILCFAVSHFMVANPFKLWGILIGIAGLIILVSQCVTRKQM